MKTEKLTMNSEKLDEKNNSSPSDVRHAIPVGWKVATLLSAPEFLKTEFLKTLEKIKNR